MAGFEYIFISSQSLKAKKFARLRARCTRGKVNMVEFKGHARVCPIISMLLKDVVER